MKLFLNIFTDDNGDNSNNEGSDNEDKEKPQITRTIKARARTKSDHQISLKNRKRHRGNREENLSMDSIS